MKRYLIGLAAAAFVGSTVLASAAALDVSGGTAQTATVNAACDADGDIDFWHRWDPEDTTPVSYGPKITGIDPACEGLNLVVFGYDEDGEDIATLIVPSPASGTIDGGAFNWDQGPVDMADIEYVNITIIS